MTLDRLPFRVAQALLLTLAICGALLYGYLAALLLTMPTHDAVSFTFAVGCAAMFVALGCAVSQGYFRWRGRTF